MSRILIRGARILDPACRRDEHGDVLIEQGRIAALELPGKISEEGCQQIIDADGKWLMPGLIDPHVHLRDPGYPQKETIISGLKAAAAGGFTAVAAMANTLPVNDSPEITAYILEQGRKARAARLIPVSAVTRNLAGRELVDFAAMAQAGAHLFSDDGIPLDDVVVLRQAIEQTGALGSAISLHEEDRELSGRGAFNEGPVARTIGVPGIPGEAESRRVGRDLELLTHIHSRYQVHLAHISTAESVTIVRAAKRAGLAVSCEATPHHFTLEDRAALEFGPYAKMNPPLRTRADVEAISAALDDGTIDMIATDHAPHDPGSKNIAGLAAAFAGLREVAGGGHREEPLLDESQCEAMCGAANGIVGLETAVGLAMRLVHGGLITPLKLVELMSTNPARLLRLEDAGKLLCGAPADICIIDPALKTIVNPRRFLSKSRNTPFAGWELTGRAILTFVGGEVVYDGRN